MGVLTRGNVFGLHSRTNFPYTVVETTVSVGRQGVSSG